MKRAAVLVTVMLAVVLLAACAPWMDIQPTSVGVPTRVYEATDTAAAVAALPTQALPAEAEPTALAAATAEIVAAMELPVIISEGEVPADTCVVAHPGSTAVVDIRHGPGQQYEVFARLGNWAPHQTTALGWHMIELPTGETGWVSEHKVMLAGVC